MKNLIILVKMQVKEQMNFKRMELDGISPFKIFLSVLVALLKFAFVAALCFAFLWVSNYLQLFSFTSRIPTEVISIVFSVMLAASVISCSCPREDSCEPYLFARSLVSMVFRKTKKR